MTAEQKQEQESKSQVIKLASQDARIKAEAIAVGFNKKVGRLVTVSLNEFNYMPWRLYDSATAGTAETAKESVTNITPSEQEVNAYVTAVYKLR